MTTFEIIIIVLLATLIVSLWIVGRKLFRAAHEEPIEPDPRVDEVLQRLERHRELIQRLTEMPGELNELRMQASAGKEQRKNLQEYLSETRRTIDELHRRLGNVSQSETKNAELLERLHRVLLGAIEIPICN